MPTNNEDIGHHEVTENCNDVDFKEVIMQDWNCKSERLMTKQIKVSNQIQMLFDVKRNPESCITFTAFLCRWFVVDCGKNVLIVRDDTGC